MKLRQYQRDAVEAIEAGWGDSNKQLLVLPTGGGKTVVFSALAHRMQPGRTLILAHRDELVDQAIDKLYRSTGLIAQKEKAEWKASRNAEVVVASVQTMARRLDKWPQDHFRLVVADEAHHAISDSWQSVLRHFDQHAHVLGVTATADRGDKKNLGQYFINVAAEVTLFDLINQGYLAPISIQTAPLEIDLAGVKQTAGDYDAGALGDALAPYMRSIAQTIADVAAFRRTLVFVPLCATSREFVEVCRSEGIAAEHIDGNSPDRQEILRRFAAGEIELLSNAMLLTEGFDDPGIDCLVVLRPTRSRALYSQMVGRGTRIAPGKQNLLLLDFLWMHEKHNLIRPAHLVSQNDEVAKIITEISSKGGGQSELDLQGLESEAKTQRESKLREELEKQRKKKSKNFDAMEFCLSVHASGAADYEPTMPWEHKPPTQHQIEMLEKAGVDPESVETRGHASQICDLIISRRKLNLATPKQLKHLKKLGHPSPETATFQEASNFLDKRFKGGKKTAKPKSENVPF